MRVHVKNVRRANEKRPTCYFILNYLLLPNIEISIGLPPGQLPDIPDDTGMPDIPPPRNRLRLRPKKPESDGAAQEEGGNDTPTPGTSGQSSAAPVRPPVSTPTSSSGNQLVPFILLPQKNSSNEIIFLILMTIFTAVNTLTQFTDKAQCLKQYGHYPPNTPQKKCLSQGNYAQ